MSAQRHRHLNSIDLTPPVPVAIIGMGCMFAKAGDLASYWANIRGRLDAITEVPSTHWSPDDYCDDDPRAPDRTYARRGGFLSPVDFPPLEFGIAPTNLDATDTTQLLGLMVARQALEDAGYGAGRDFDRDRVSVILGVTGTLELVIPLGARLGHPIWRRALRASGVDEATAAEVVRRISDSYVGWQENSFPGLLGNVAAGRIANRLDLGGTNCVIDAACASSIGALHLAQLELSAGRCDLALTGGLDTFNDIFMYMCFSKTPALSPSGDARPFDAGGDGTILGEGLGVLALKRLDDARRDGDRVYAVIRGIGSSSDGKGNAVYAPSATGQAKALRRAYELSGTPPETIELVEGHGTGTKVGDAIELTALHEVYRESGRQDTWCALGSVKSQIGHTKAAAGAAGLIKAALALHHKVLPPTIKVTRPIESSPTGQSPFYINAEPRPWLSRPEHPRRAAVSSFGFGGSNFHCVLEEADDEKAAIDWDGDVQIVAFSAENPEALRTAFEGWPCDLAWDELRTEAARSRSRFRTEEAYRLTLVIERGKTDLPRLWTQVRGHLMGGGQHTGKGNGVPGTSGLDGVFSGIGAASGQLALLFPGQGSQYPGMLRDLACQFPQMQSALGEADRVLDIEGGRLSDLIYPHSSFTEDERAGHEQSLRATEIAQPAIGAISLGLIGILDHFGVRADAVAGHSYGELTALCAAGRIDSKTLLFLSRHRGQLMAGQGGDRGAMLAVSASIDVVESVVREGRLDLVVANKNAPRQAILSGPAEEVDRATRLFEARKVSTRPLAVSAAFHSRFVAEARGPFLEALREVEISATRIPVFANTTALPYPDDPDEARELLAGQLALPVEFVGQIEAMSRSEISTFLEVGPDSKLTGLVHAILAGREHVALAVDASRGTLGNVADLARALAQLAAIGYPVRLPLWDEGVDIHAEPRKPVLTVKVCGANPTPKPQPTPLMTPKVVPAMTPPTPSKHSLTPAPATNGTHPAPSIPARNGAHASPLVFKPSPVATHPPVLHDQSVLAQALQTAQENLVALQKHGEQTALLHRQFLDGQDSARHTFQTLLEHQQRLTYASLGIMAPTSPPISPRVIDPPPSRETSPSPAPKRFLSQADQSSAPARSVPAPDPAPAPVTLIAAPASSLVRAQSVLLEVVSEKTGYPVEMLEPGMQLDADLGIDSIKRVEILSALQERLPDAPAVKPEHLGTLRTLGQIAEFLSQQEVTPTTLGRTDRGPVIMDVLLDVVSAKTGYPVEMLEPGMQLDADLGIDSIKRVEILSALQERLPDAPAVRPEHLGTLRTLGQIAEFLSQFESALSPPVLTFDRIGAILMAVVSEKTGYPVEMLEPDMQLDADLGIDSIKRVEILSALQERLPDAPAVKPEHLGTLRTLGQIAEFLADGTSVGAPPVPPVREASPPPSPVESATVQRLVLRRVVLDERARREAIVLRTGATLWITEDGSALTGAIVRQLEALGHCCRVIPRAEIGAISAPERLDGLIILAPAAGLGGLSITDAFRLVRAAAPGLRRAGVEGGAVLVSITRLDGSFGTRELAPDADFESGGLAGLTKTARHEWPEVACKAIDLDPTFDDLSQAVSVLIEEMFLRGPAEVGLSRDDRCTLELVPTALPNEVRTPPFRAGDLVVISGGARGITAEVAVALAEAFRPTLLLLGRSPEPVLEPEWLAPIDAEAEIKRILLARANGHATPQSIGEQYRQLASNREVLRNLRRIEAAGSKVIYRSVDVRDEDAIGSRLEEARSVFGPVRGLIHGAGVLADRRIDDQNDEQFATVYDTKVDGLRALIQSVGADDLKVMVLFSSSTARFGRTGQVAYAAANEVMNKRAWVEAQARPACRVVSINWGPWDGGMVTPSLRPIFEAEGVPLISPRDGARYLVDEIQATADRPVEVVVLGGRSGASQSPPETLATVFDRVIDTTSLPILKSHVIDGRSVLPMALILEWLAQGALQRNPGLAFLGINDFRVLKGVILDPDRPETVRVLAGKALREGSVYLVPVELRGALHDGREVPHARGEVVLADRYSPQGPSIDALALPPLVYGKGEIYRNILFHGPDLQGIEHVEGCGEAGIVARVSSAPPPASWIEQPLRPTWLADPLVLDCAFQMMILWSVESLGQGSLPTSVGRYRQFRRAFPAQGIRIIAQVTQSGPHRATADIEFLDQDGTLFARMEEYECVIDVSLNQAFRRNQPAPAARG